MRKSIKSETYDEQVAPNFPELNKVWLLLGKGEMLKSSEGDVTNWGNSKDVSKSEGSFSVPLLPVSAIGGELAGWDEGSVEEWQTEIINSPISNVDFGLTVTGDSMHPEYPNGSRILVKKINEKAFIDWGRVYVLDTCNGTVIKK